MQDGPLDVTDAAFTQGEVMHTLSLRRASDLGFCDVGEFDIDGRKVFGGESLVGTNYTEDFQT